MKDEYDFAHAETLTPEQREKLLEMFVMSNQCRAWHVVDEHDEIEGDFEPTSYYCVHDAGHSGKHRDHEGREFDA
jgi:hypothetical protein